MFFNEPFGGIIPGARGAVLAVLLRTDTPLTGRQIHGLLSDKYSLWIVQKTLKALTGLGLVHSQSVGRAQVHTVNEEHVSVAPLRALLDPIAVLRDVVRTVTNSDVSTVYVFGSIGRGEATAESDIDLAVIAGKSWDKRVELADAVRTRLGNDCVVLVFNPAEFKRLARAGEPVVNDIVRDGLVLVGAKPRINHGAA